mmetsp:Transcript_2031/g.4512  ORF Transcript_2031/g.4512 Transcript_2031/m.4512 type:complete len:86 (-) Transcript_2031:55-312(-)
MYSRREMKEGSGSYGFTGSRTQILDQWVASSKILTAMQAESGFYSSARNKASDGNIRLRLSLFCYWYAGTKLVLLSQRRKLPSEI